MERALSGQPVVPGHAAGRAVVLHQPLSLWGGFSPRTGEIIDRRHDRSGTLVGGTVLVLPHGKGSSTASAVLLEAIRAGCAPAAIITRQADPILALGAIVAEQLYGTTVPMVVLASDDYSSLADGDDLAIEPDGTVRVYPGCGR